jgi:glycosyltransferase involved in cell wall biosynthesis
MISVIIPTYKTTEALDLCLKSAIEGQKNKNQIIVVVDGFFDLNKKVLKKYEEHINVLNLEENQGTCRALNLGVYNANYEKILIVNDDNVFPKDWDLKLELDYKKGYVFSPNQVEPYPSMFSQFNIKDLGQNVQDFDLDQFWEYEKNISSPKIESNGSTFPIFMNKLDYMRLGGFDVSYPSQAGYVTDWDFFLKCQLSGLTMSRLFNCHFYHFVALSNKSQEQKIQSDIEEKHCHRYAEYKWGTNIKHNQETNLKYI